MIVFKTIDEYSRETGKKTGEKKVFDYMICDFTGKLMSEFFGNPVIYEVDYNDTDPCFGDHVAERWLYDWNEIGAFAPTIKKHILEGPPEFSCEGEREEDFQEIDSYDLFGQPRYIFGTDDDGTEVFTELLKEVKKEKFEIVSLDHLLRWSRGRMLEKLFKEGKYKPEQFIQ